MRLLFIFLLAFSATAQKMSPHKNPAGKQRMVDSEGNVIHDNKYTFLQRIGDSLLIFSQLEQKGSADTIVRLENSTQRRLIFPDNRFGLMDLNGNIVLEPLYSGFKVTGKDAEGNYLIVSQQTLSLAQQMNIAEMWDGAKPYLVGLLSPDGKVLSSPAYSDFYRQGDFLYAGVLAYDGILFREAYSVPQSKQFYQGNSCIVQGYDAEPKPVSTYYPRLVIYNNQLEEVGHFRGNLSSGHAPRIYGTTHIYYFFRDKLIDSVAITRKYNEQLGRGTVEWKNDPCGFYKEEYTREGYNKPAVVKNDFGSLTDIFSERGHCLLDKNGDTVLFSAENHFFRFPGGNEIHIRTCAGRWGLADTLGNELVPTVSEVPVLYGKHFIQTMKNGKEVWLNKALQPIEGLKVLPEERFSVQYTNTNDFPFYFVVSNETRKYGLIDTTGKMVVPAVYKKIRSGKAGFWVTRRHKEGLIAFDGTKLHPVTYRQQLVSYKIKTRKISSLGRKWIPETESEQFLIMERGKRQGIVSINKKTLLSLKKRHISHTGYAEFFSVREDKSFRIFNAALGKFVTEPLSEEKYVYNIFEDQPGSVIIVIDDRYSGISRTLRADGTPANR